MGEGLLFVGRIEEWIAVAKGEVTLGQRDDLSKGCCVSR